MVVLSVCTKKLEKDVSVEHSMGFQTLGLQRLFSAFHPVRQHQDILDIKPGFSERLDGLEGTPSGGCHILHPNPCGSDPS